MKKKKMEQKGRERDGLLVQTCGGQRNRWESIQRVEGNDDGGGNGWLWQWVAMQCMAVERSKMSEGRKREYCERESETKRERAHEIPK